MTEFNDFPQGVATGQAFLGREAEVNILTENIKHGHHTLLIAPRRFGKTSLALNVLKKLEIPYAELNFHLALTEKSIESKILIGVQDILKSIATKPEKLFKIFNEFLKKTKVRLSLTIKGVLNIELGIEHSKNEDIPENILATLKLAEHVLAEHHKKAVIFIDEIQEIDGLDTSRQIEGAIREFAQKSQYLVFIFSGSNRRMLLHMFDDKSMPLYELCERITLERIDEESYRYYLTKMAKKTWGKPLAEAVFNEIMLLSERHPRRVYNLCFQLWRNYGKNKNGVSERQVRETWNDYIAQRLKDIRYHLSRLTRSQLKVLTFMAISPASELTGKQAQHRMDLASSTITQALNILEDNDYVERLGKGDYRIIDPLVKAVLANYEKENLNG
jgi:AAA+ ATPase superfamily predicted ATPase